MTETELAATRRVRAWWAERGLPLYKNGEPFRALAPMFVRETSEHTLTEDIVFQLLVKETGENSPDEHI